MSDLLDTATASLLRRRDPAEPEQRSSACDSSNPCSLTIAQSNVQAGDRRNDQQHAVAGLRGDAHPVRHRRCTVPAVSQKGKCRPARAGTVGPSQHLPSAQLPYVGVEVPRSLARCSGASSQCASARQRRASRSVEWRPREALQSGRARRGALCVGLYVPMHTLRCRRRAARPLGRCVDIAPVSTFYGRSM